MGLAAMQWQEIIELVRLMRDLDVHIAPSEAADCLTGLQLLGEENYETVIRATLLKDAVKRDLWYKLQDLRSLMKLPDFTEKQAENVSTAALDGGGQEKPGSGGAGGDLHYLLTCSRDHIFRHVKSMVAAQYQQLGGTITEQVKQVKRHYNWFMVLRKLEHERETGQISEYRYLNTMEKLRHVENAIELVLVQLNLEQKGCDMINCLKEHWNVTEKNWINLSQVEMQQVKQLVVKLGRKLAVRYSQKYKTGAHRKILLRPTFQQALKHQGLPIKLVKGRRRLEKPRLVVLCDVSRSVARFTHFMLTLVYSFQTKHRQVRSFVFVDHPVEVTRWFRELPLEEVLQKINNNTLFSWSGFSDFGNVFLEMNNLVPYLDAQRSHLIIVADARNNWKAPRLDQLERLRRSFKKIWWFNPLPEEQWDQEDCLMSLFMPYLDRAFACPNYRALAGAVAGLR